LFIAVPDSELEDIHTLAISITALAKLANIHKRLPAAQVVKIMREGVVPAASIKRDPRTVAIFGIGGALFWEAVDHILSFHPMREYNTELNKSIVELAKLDPKEAFFRTPEIVLEHLGRKKTRNY
jgi:hypothetical protein